MSTNEANKKARVRQQHTWCASLPSSACVHWSQSTSFRGNGKQAGLRDSGEVGLTGHAGKLDLTRKQSFGSQIPVLGNRLYVLHKLLLFGGKDELTCASYYQGK